MRVAGEFSPDFYILHGPHWAARGGGVPTPGPHWPSTPLVTLQITNVFQRKVQSNCYQQKRSLRLKMHQKPFGSRVLPGPDGELTVLPHTP